MAQLGAVTASALDAGAVDGDGVRRAAPQRPSDAGREIAVERRADLGYAGVYVPPPARAGAVAEPRRRRRDSGLSYGSSGPRRCRRRSSARTARRSRSTPARGRPARIASRGRARRRPPRPRREGLWRFAVTATDDQGQVSQAERTFALNNTLAALQRAPAAVKLRRRARGSRRRSRSRTRQRSPRRSRRREASSSASSRGGRSPPAGARSRGTAAPAPARSRMGRVLASTSPRRTRSAEADLYAPSQRAGRLAARVLLASVSSSLTSFVRDHGLYAVFDADGDRRRLPGCQRARDGRRRRRRGGRVRRLVLALRRGAAARLPVVPRGRRSRARSATSSARSSAGGSASTAAGRCSTVTAAGSTSAPEQLDRAEAWFDRYDDWAVLVGRVTPVVRSFVSIPAGHLPRPVRALRRC